MIHTERLRLYPASREQMEAVIVSEQDGELKKAYSEMLDGCLRHPERWDWYAMWMIEEKDGMHIGDLCFKGLREDGVAEIGYGILAAFQGHGYATEAVKGFRPEITKRVGITEVYGIRLLENAASGRVLDKCDFQAFFTGTGAYHDGVYEISKSVWKKQK